MFGGISRLLYVGADRWRAVLFVGGVLFVLGSGIAVVSGVPMQDETDPSSVGTITLERQHHARVVEGASIYRPGERIRGKSLYLLSETPNVTVREVVRTDTGPPVAVDLETRVVYRVQYSDSEIYRERGASVRESGTISDENVTADMVLHMRRIDARLRSLRDEFGNEVSVRATLVTRVAASSGPSGSSPDSIVTRTPITFTSRGYHVPATVENERYGVAETVRKPVPDRTVSLEGIVVGHTQLFGLVLALVGLSVAGVSAGYLRRMTEADREALYRTVMHRRFDELIATVESGDCPAVDREMESLHDLVYVGNDGDEPVLHFPAVDRYVVQCDGVVYGYRFTPQPFVFGDGRN